MTREERLKLIRTRLESASKTESLPTQPVKTNGPNPNRSWQRPTSKERARAAPPGDAKAKNSLRMNEHYARRRASGLCHACGAPSPDTAACAACRAAKAQYRARLREERARRGCCTHCVQPAKPGQRMCQRCQDDRRERVKQQRRAGR